MGLKARQPISNARIWACLSSLFFSFSLSIFLLFYSLLSVRLSV